jgi:hypothetical protein
MSYRKGCGKTPIRNAPSSLKSTLGTPNWSIILLSKPCLKKVILPKFPNRWNIATKIIAVLKSTNSRARGRNIVDEPKPAIVPIISAISAEMKNNISSSTFLVCYILYKYQGESFYSSNSQIISTLLVV